MQFDNQEISRLPNTLLVQGRELGQGRPASVVVTPEAQIALADGAAAGSFISEPLTDLPPFTNMVASWNSATTAGTYVELMVRVSYKAQWSRWFSYGRWSDGGNNGGSIRGQEDQIARLDTDLLHIKAPFADTIQYKLNLFRSDTNQNSPRVRLVGFTWTPAELKRAGFACAEIALDVAPRAQLPIPEIGNKICSPTSLATVMAYHGIDEETECVAAGARDNGAKIYGNWSYNVAYAAERGFTAWVQRCDSLDDVKRLLLQGLPVIASIRTTDKKELDGTQMPYPAGHLVVITGFTCREGAAYVLVKDPAAHRPEDVPRQYRLEQFDQAWTRKLIYVVAKQPKGTVDCSR